MAWQIIIDQDRDRDKHVRMLAILRNREQISHDEQELIAKYGKGTYVAYFGGKEVDHGVSLEELRERLMAEYSEGVKSMAIEKLGEPKTTDAKQKATDH